MPRCWHGRCQTCHAACYWTSTNGRHCTVPSISARPHRRSPRRWSRQSVGLPNSAALLGVAAVLGNPTDCLRSEEHTSELQSRLHLVCRLLLEKKKNVRRDR